MLTILNLGDGILVQAQGSTDGKWFEGLVVDVRSEEVALHFTPSAKGSFSGWTATRAYSIRFNLNRYPLRRQHQALNRPFNDDRIFFPLAVHVKPLTTFTPNVRPMYNPLIAANPAQLLAVKTILRLPPGSHPFIVYGP